MQKSNTVPSLLESDFQYRTFHENLADKLDFQEISSLNVLGKDFFRLIDHLSTELLTARTEDSSLLGLSLQEFLWELQIFINQFIRQEAGNVMRLRGFCSECLEQLKTEEFRKIFMEKVSYAYCQYFFVQESNHNYLV